tara:strand:+ start:218 stop:352 length:135 start_codon:yes stop_codon:yes gene_type:complete
MLELGSDRLNELDVESAQAAIILQLDINNTSNTNATVFICSVLF